MLTVITVQRLEGLAILLGALWFYFAELEGHWLAFAALLLAPDLAMLGYLAGNRAGAAAYNAAHTLALPAILAVAGVASGNDLVTGAALIFAAHAGMDRAFGYGLKHTSGFHHTHLGDLRGGKAQKRSA